MQHKPETLQAERQVLPVSYSVEDAAKALGIGRTFVFKLIKDGHLKAIKVGRRTLITLREIEAFLDRSQGAA